MSDTQQNGFTPLELRDFRRLAGIMIPASAEFGSPGADDERIFADIVRSVGRDRQAVRTVLAELGDLAARAGGGFAELGQAEAQRVAMALLERKGALVTALGRAVLQCYYRDDRVLGALGLEPRAPFPKGHSLPSGDWSLLDAVRGRPRMWRDVDGMGS